MTLITIGLIAACWYMTGLMWLTQLVSYPALATVPAGDAPALERTQQARLVSLSMPATLVALVTGVLVAINATSQLATWLAIALVALLMLVGLAVGSVQSAQHQRLMKAFDAAVHRRMVAGNWLTTLGWTTAAVLATAIGVAA